MTALDQWQQELEAWRIDDDILAAAPESPYFLPPEQFRADDRDRSTVPTTRLAREALPPAGSVIDVGCGAGAASFPLVPAAASLVGVDTRESMLAAFRDTAADRGVAVRGILGRWPDVAPLAGEADVVLSANVAYDVADLAAFAVALTAHARRRVVLELHAVHPWVPLGPLWEAVHGQDRPTGPSAELAVEVLAEVGIAVQVESWPRPPRRQELPRSLLVAMTRRRLCLPIEREPEVDALLGEDPRIAVDEMVTVWWDI